ncbi:MAG: hypothetical protein NT075_28125 [Chloroflexi bacterium]|nr:hypothetical protein [Chloroflexota bacterium]
MLVPLLPQSVCRHLFTHRPIILRAAGLVCLLSLALLLGLYGDGQRVIAQTPTNPDAEIVFIDNNGFIRALDTTPTTNRPLVGWVSPTGGWTDFAVGDVNNDGDAEIVAIGGDANSGKLAVYDPVVTAGSFDPTQVINGIPWATLYEVSIPGKPTIIAAGDLKPTVLGDEIVYGYLLNNADKVHSGDQMRLVLLQAANVPADGRSWRTQIAPHDFEEAWTRLTVGDIDGHAGAELILIGDRGKTHLLSIYRIEQELIRLYRNESNDRAWYSAAIGKFRPDDVNQVAAVREGQIGLDSLFVMRFNTNRTGNFEDVYSELFTPPPLNVFFANVNGSADEEVFMLRDVPNTLPAAPHFFMRNRGKDAAIGVNLRLDTDNGYKVGAGGDIDGDGKDEVVIMRNNRIRIYPNIDTALNFEEYSFLTNAFSLKIADLDKNGSAPVAQLVATPSQTTVALEAGLVAQLLTVNVTNGSTNDSVPFSVAIEGNPTWVTVTPTSGQTPATLALNFDARALAVGQYIAKLNIQVGSSAIGIAPPPIELVLNVTPGLTVQPVSTIATIYPCTPPLSEFTQTVALEGPAGQAVTAQVLGANSSQPAWVTSITLPSPPVLPATASIRIDPSKRTADFEPAILHLETKTSPTSFITRDFTFDLLCANAQLYAPLIAR